MGSLRFGSVLRQRCLAVAVLFEGYSCVGPLGFPRSIRDTTAPPIASFRLVSITDDSVRVRVAVQLQSSRDGRVDFMRLCATRWSLGVFRPHSDQLFAEYEDTMPSDGPLSDSACALASPSRVTFVSQIPGQFSYQVDRTRLRWLRCGELVRLTARATVCGPTCSVQSVLSDARFVRVRCVSRGRPTDASSEGADASVSNRRPEPSFFDHTRQLSASANFPATSDFTGLSSSWSRPSYFDSDPPAKNQYRLRTDEQFFSTTP
jgi:hypothetical protein